MIPIKAEQSLHEVLMDQLSMLALDERAFKIAEQIIGSLDDDGYLRRAMQSIADDLAFKQSMWVEEKEIEFLSSGSGFADRVIGRRPFFIYLRDFKKLIIVFESLTSNLPSSSTNIFSMTLFLT